MGYWRSDTEGGTEGPQEDGSGCVAGLQAKASQPRLEQENRVDIQDIQKAKKRVCVGEIVCDTMIFYHISWYIIYKTEKGRNRIGMRFRYEGKHQQKWLRVPRVPREGLEGGQGIATLCYYKLCRTFAPLKLYTTLHF